MKRVDRNRFRGVLGALLCLALSACSGGTDSVPQEAPVPRDLVLGIRTGNSVVAMLEQATGVSRTDGTVQAVYQRVGSSLNWNGGSELSEGQVRAAADLAFAFCEVNTRNGTLRSRLFGSFRFDIAPRSATTGALVHTDVELEGAIHQLYLRFSGKRITTSAKAELLEAAKEYLTVTPVNDGGGTRHAMITLCATVASLGMNLVSR